ncbi:bifunctional deaminase-reductase domain protein [Methanobacterium lacus]|uniref:Bifunctional deaminase-reductase domain protein n=1 Tax=Methanobacterium lacus (strain AL-21) TaxID=877455 RepID=F0T7Z5_METLA|nr:dihydrofolate reductase family protein [Methanobacterium lacus]ADZ09621.1 bifunctional deaminase-reductase domain protein [Methanobacterium lacus]
MNYVYIAISLDGFIARPDGGLDWLENLDDPEDDYGFSDFIDKIDALVMGRKTFESVLKFDEWPFTKPVFVLSTTIQTVPNKLRGKVEVLNGHPKKIVEELNSKEFNNLYIDGGQTIQRFLKEDLIHEMIITTASVILGEGIPLFNGISGDIKFKCERVEVLNPYLVKHYYERDK